MEKKKNVLEIYKILLVWLYAALGYICNLLATSDISPKASLSAPFAELKHDVQ